MRVALVNHSGEISGAEVSLLGTAVALVQRGVRVLLVVPESGELVARARAAGHDVRTAPFPAPRMSRNPVLLAGGLMALVRGAARLAGILRAERVDVVHANSVRAGLMASFGRPLHRRPVVWSVRDFLSDGPIGRGVRMVAGAGADAIIGNSDAVTADFARWPRLSARSRTIYPTVPPEAFETSRAGDLRKAWGVPPPAKVVGCVGQIAPWKRVHDVIAAFRTVSAGDPEAWLVVVGAPKFRAENRDYQRRLERLVAESGLGGRVVFVGHEDDIERVFRSVDVLVHAAEREPFGRVLVEAMAQGVPVVATADGGVPEIVRDGETGFLVALGDTDAMARRTMDLLGDPALRRRMGDRGRTRASECFRADRSAERLLDVYLAVLGRSV
jgi:glycosyltransferase involved in cell wall biosynthesis